MAVTKIHRTSRTVLLLGIAVSLVVMLLFYLGGQVAPQDKLVADMSEPKYTDLVLYWMYLLLGITVVVLIGFAIIGFFKGLKENPKKAMGGLVVLLLMAALLVITYVMGDGTVLNIPGYEGVDNVPAMLKLTDMWLYSTYFILALTILAIVVMPLFARKK